MKKYLMLLIVLFSSMKSFSQAQELAELALDIEKLAQFKQILSDMKKGYTILSGGYNTIKNLSQGNFSLHKGFLDGLMAVSPAVRKYHKIALIIQYQGQLIKEYKAAYKRCKQAGLFSAAEIDYISKVYARLLEESLSGLDALLMLITPDRLRMSDEERLTAIDGIHEDMENKLVFLRHFNNQTAVLALQRAREAAAVGGMQSMYGIEK